MASLQHLSPTSLNKAEHYKLQSNLTFLKLTKPLRPNKRDVKFGFAFEDLFFINIQTWTMKLKLNTNMMKIYHTGLSEESKLIDLGGSFTALAGGRGSESGTWRPPPW